MITKEFFNKYEIKKLIKEDEGESLALLLRMMSSKFFAGNKYHVVAEDTAVEQLMIEFNIPKSILLDTLRKIDEAGMFLDYEEPEYRSIEIFL